MVFLQLLFVSMGILLSVRGETKMPDGQTVHEYVEHMGLSKDKYEKLCEKTKEYRKKEMEVLGTKIDKDDMSVPIEGDIMLTDKILDDLMDQLKKIEKDHPRVKRTAFMDPTRSIISAKWSKTTFRFSFHDIDGKRQEIIERALKEIEQKTCLRFQNSLAAESHMLFSKPPEPSCSSLVGDDADWLYSQPIYLTKDCIDDYGAILHEVGHFLGMWHEQMRPDREKYVKVTRKDGKAIDDNNVNFGIRKKDVDTQHYPYDFQSIMHYPKYTLNHTIAPKDSIYDTTLGQVSELSFYDAASINEFYCRHCDTSDDCKNEGYRVISDLRCDQDCVCPDGLAGELCKGIACGHEGCRPGERVLFANYGEETCLTSPNYDDDGYHPGDQCTWLILDGDDHGHHCHIKVWFKDAFHLKARYDVCDHWVEVRLNGNTTQGQRFCGNNKHKLKFPSLEESNSYKNYGEGERGSVLVNFRSFPEADGSQGNHKYKGFKLCFTAGPCD